MWVRFTRRRALGYNEDLSGLRLSRAHHTFLPKCFMLDHACCLPHERQTGRLAISCVSIPPGRDRHSCVLAVLVRLSALASSLRLWPFLYGDLDGVPGTQGTGIRGWRHGLYALLRNHIGFVMLSAGRTLGLRAPNLRQRVFDSLDSLHAAAGLCRRKFAALVRFCVITLALQCFPRGVRWG